MASIRSTKWLECSYYYRVKEWDTAIDRLVQSTVFGKHVTQRTGEALNRWYNQIRERIIRR